MNPKISMYQSAWLTLRRKKRLEILTSNRLHAERVAKAIRKRKDLDTQFKDHKLATNRRYRIYSNLDSSGKLLTLTLVCLNDTESV